MIRMWILQIWIAKEALKDIPNINSSLELNLIGENYIEMCLSPPCWCVFLSNSSTYKLSLSDGSFRKWMCVHASFAAILLFGLIYCMCFKRLVTDTQITCKFCQRKPKNSIHSASHQPWFNPNEQKKNRIFKFISGWRNIKTNKVVLCDNKLSRTISENLIEDVF